MRQRGFTYLAVLFAVVIVGAVLGATAVVWHHQVQRDKEQELLFIGHAYRDAIAAYYEKTPGTVKQFPKKLEDLLEDKRQTRLTRYIRKLYRDPLTASKEWGLISGPGEGIIGVYSLSTRVPIKTANFEEVDRELIGATNYMDWKFVYKVPTPLATQPSAPAAQTPPASPTNTVPATPAPAPEKTP